MDRLLTRKDIAALLSFSLRTVDRMIKDRDLPCVRIGRAVRFKEKEIEKWIDNRSLKAIK